MPVAAAAIGVGASIYSSRKSAKAQQQAAGQASAAQERASQAAIDEQKRQFDEIQKLLKPYVQAGTGAIGQQQALLGLGGNQAQQQAIQGIANSPEMQAYVRQGENALLQNAAATGGLRGGNIQGALAQFRPQLLNQLVNQRFQNLGGLTSIGQASAAGVGNAGMQSASNIGNLLQQQGAAQAGNALAQGQASAQKWSNIGAGVSQLAGLAGGFLGGGGKF